MMTPQNCLVFNVQRAARRLARRLDQAMAPHGLTAQQFSLLSVLAAQDAVSTSALADMVGADRTTISRNLRPLEREGLIAPAPSEDARVSAYSLSEAGRQRWNSALPDWRSVQDRTLANLADPPPETFLSALRGL